MLDIIGIGSAFVDYFFRTDEDFLKKYNLKPEDDFLFGEKKINPNTIFSQLRPITKSPGGIALNTIATLAKLGVNVGYYGVIGKDENGDFWLKNIGRVDTSKVNTAGKMSICTCLLTHRGKRRTFVSQVNPNDFNFLKNLDYNYLNNVKFIHLGPLILNSRKGIKRSIKLIEKIIKPKLSFSPSILYIAEGWENLLPIFKKTYILFVNQKEMKYLTHQNPKSGSKKLLKYGPKIVVCTLAEKGALVTTSNDQFHSPRVDVAKIIDTTGAGDAFAAGFLYGLIKNRSLKWSANFANQIAAKSLTDFGLQWLKPAHFS